MAELIDDVTIVNRALARIAGGQVTSRDDDSDLARQAFAIYDDLVDAALAAWRWNWPRQTRALDRIAAAPENGWAYGFLPPAGALGEPLRLMTSPRHPDNPLREFQVEGGVVYCDAEALWGAFVMRAEPALWPALYRLAFTTWLAAQLCVPVTHDSNLAQALTVEAVGNASENLRGGLMGRAIALDAAGANALAPGLARDPITDAWHGGV